MGQVQCLVRPLSIIFVKIGSPSNLCPQALVVISSSDGVAGAVMTQFDSLGPSLVGQFVIAVKAELDRRPSSFSMAFTPGEEGSCAGRVWEQLSPDSSATTSSRLSILDLLLHLCPKWEAVCTSKSLQALQVTAFLILKVQKKSIFAVRAACKADLSL